MAEKLIFHKKQNLIQCICGNIGYIGFYQECEKNFNKIIFSHCSDNCNVGKKEPRTDDHCHLVCAMCHDELAEILKKEK